MLEKLKIDKKYLEQLDISIIILVVMIALFGIANIFCATQPINKSGYRFTSAGLQFAWLILGLTVIYLILTIDYYQIMKYAPIIYWASIALLVFNDVTSKAIKGQNNWIQIGNRAIQPSEFAKLAMVIMVSVLLYEMEGKINDIRNLFKVLVYIFIPVVLILLEGDMGMTMVSFFITLGMMFIVGLDIKIITGGLAAIAAMIQLVWNTNLIKPYQKLRLTSFLNPAADAQNTGYQLTQSQIAIGSGGLLGKGFLQGVRTMGGYVPESSTDFIFAVIGEQFGLVGAAVLLIFYGILIYRMLSIAKNAKDLFGNMLCVGIISSIMFSVLENIGMTIRIMPISGITLPFVSYGGSSMLANCIGIGLVLNVGMRRKKINF